LEEKLSPLIIGNQKDEDLKFEKHYSYALLGDQLIFYRELIRLIAEHTEKIYLFINKIENKEESVLGLEGIYDNDPNNIKLEFKVNKLSVVFFYRALLDADIIFVDNKNQNKKYPYTNLNKYIDQANTYFLGNEGSEKVTGCGKEFSKIGKPGNPEYKRQEIELLDLVISAFNSRKEKLLANKEEGQL
jgi:hypothetical protein